MDDVREQLWRMPIGERLAMLTISIIEDNRNDPARVAMQMVAATRKLTEPLSDVDRFKVSERLRCLADILERRALTRV